MEENKSKKVSAVSLGCDKNRVDLEQMLFALKDAGYEIVQENAEADVVIVNTCAFITPAKEEALSNIFKACLLKEKGSVQKVIVSGCLAQRYAQELSQQIPEVDAFLSAKDNQNIVEIVDKLLQNTRVLGKGKMGRVFTSRGSYAYLKIADGCSNVCSYCTIPRIKGRYVSQKMETLVSEAKLLAEQGIRELVLVAQDVTRYGEDLYGKNCLIDLCRKLCKISGIEWIRIHYAYPEKVTKELLDYMAKEPKICKYLDIPLQHIDDRILKSMRRKMGEDKTRKLIDTLHKDYPQISLRTTFIVGYPTESRADFKKLCNFVRENKFDYAGFFPYYREENTASYFMDGQKSHWTKQHRLKKIQKLQQKVATEKASAKIGQVFDVLIDYFDESKGVYVGHDQFLSPTVDFGVEIVDNNNISTGKIVKVKYVDFDGENFKGEYYESSK